MKILALEPYYGGSHRYFLDHWIKHSRHQWQLLTLPPKKWKWRMRHSAITFQELFKKSSFGDTAIDLIFCSDMLNLAEWKGFASNHIRDIPSIAYFHENQLTYPLHPDEILDLQYGFINFTTALSANQVWFNSNFHRDEFFAAVKKLLKKMPDFSLLHHLEQILEKTKIYYPGIDPIPLQNKKQNSIPTFLWVARWEYDKNPELFFKAFQILKQEKYSFKLNILGESFDRSPHIFHQAKKEFENEIEHFGFIPSRKEYLKIFKNSDFVLSTSIHEFFGISILEAYEAGNYPLLPKRLAYPEVFQYDTFKDFFFYEGSLNSLLAKLKDVCQRFSQNTLWKNMPLEHKKLTEKFYWKNISNKMDDAIDKIEN